MTRNRSRLGKTTQLLFLSTGLGLALNGCGITRLMAATRSTAHFLPSPTDARVFYEPGADGMARVVAAELPAAIERVENRQFGRFAIPVRIYVCASIESFVEYGAPPTAGGLTLNQRVFLSPKPENTAERIPRVLTHELSHLHLGQKRGLLSFARLPVWFGEGLAVEVSEGGGAEGVSEAEARREIAEGRTFVPETEASVRNRKGANVYGLAAHMFYRQASLFVSYLRSTDEGRFRSFLLAVEGGEAFASTFEAAYGFTISEAWRRFTTEVAGQRAARPPIDRLGDRGGE